jgi:hypothetical protein
MSINNNPDHSNRSNNGGGSQPVAQSPVDSDDSSKAGRRSFRSLIWVFIIILIGIVTGIFSFILITPHIGIVLKTPVSEIIFPLPGNLVYYLAWHIILSTVSIALLVSLVIVYTKTYSQTKANFSLGIVIVLLALLLESILNYPIYQVYIGVNPDVWLSGSGSSYFVADLFTIIAYSVFLYLSLQ